MNVSTCRLFIALIAVSLLCLFIFFSIPALRTRMLFEDRNRRYELCLEYEELKKVAEFENMPLLPAVHAFKNIGVTVMAVHQVGLQRGDAEHPYHPLLKFDEQALNEISDAGLKILSRPVNPYFLENKRIALRLLSSDLPEQSDLFLCAGDEAYGYPLNLSMTAHVLAQRKIRPVWLEFGKQKGDREIAEACLGSAIKAHSATLQDMSRIPDRTVLLYRYVRAVRERGVRLLYVHLLPECGLGGNKKFISSLVKVLSDKNYMPGTPVECSSRQTHNFFVRQMVSFIIALITPLVSAYLGILVIELMGFKLRWILSYAIINLMSMLGGLFAASFLSVPAYMSGLYQFRGVKAAYVLPVLLLSAIVFRKDMLPFLLKPVQWVHLAVAAGAVSIGAILLVRSGNYSFFNTELEGLARNFLEYILSVRPRTKEFLLAQPVLVYACYRTAQINIRDITKLPMLVRAVFCFAFIGQASIINTFLHVHTPLHISIMRTLHGQWIGLIVGILAIFFLSFIRPHIKQHVLHSA